MTQLGACSVSCSEGDAFIIVLPWALSPSQWCRQWPQMDEGAQSRAAHGNWPWHGRSPSPSALRYPAWPSPSCSSLQPLSPVWLLKVLC